MKVDMRDAFFEHLVRRAYQDDRIVFLTADHGAFALKEFESEIPDRYINLGIAEQNMMGVAAGLAASGKIVFAYGIAPFVSLRVLEQLTIDVAAMGLPVNVVSVGAGFTYSTDGPTHHGLQDMSAVLTIPEMSVLNSSDPDNTRYFIEHVIDSPGPHYLRIEKEKVETLPKVQSGLGGQTLGFSIIKDSPARGVLVLSTGIVTHEVLECLDNFETEMGLRCTLIDVFQVKPFPKKLIEIVSQFDQVISVEEGYPSGFASHVLLNLAGTNINLKSFSILSLKDTFYFCYNTRQKLVAKLKIEEKLRTILYG